MDCRFSNLGLSNANFGWLSSAEVDHTLNMQEIESRLASLANMKIDDSEERLGESDEESTESLTTAIASGALAPHCSRSNSGTSTPTPMDAEEATTLNLPQYNSRYNSRRPTTKLIVSTAAQVITPPGSTANTPVLGSVMSPLGSRSPLGGTDLRGRGRLHSPSRVTSPGTLQSPTFDLSEPLSPSRGKPLSPLVGIGEDEREEPLVITRTVVNAFGKRPSEEGQGDPDRVKRRPSNDDQDSDQFNFSQLEAESKLYLSTLHKPQEFGDYPAENQRVDPDSMIE